MAVEMRMSSSHVDGQTTLLDLQILSTFLNLPPFTQPRASEKFFRLTHYIPSSAILMLHFNRALDHLRAPFSAIVKQLGRSSDD